MNLFKPKFWDKNRVSFFSILLFPISIVIQLLSFLKKSITKTYESSIPVICVGNIYLGGTGKTPMCIEIFSILKDLNMNPGFIRKEYNSFKDEFDLQKQVGPIYQSKKRMVALKNAIKNKINIAILDDGFQDFSIKKNLSIICFSEKQWIGNGFTIPSGPLRENLSALKRADCVIINGEKNINIERKIYQRNENIKIFYIKYKVKSIDQLKNKKITAFAGIGNPESFFNLLKDNNMNVIEEIKFPDHYNYSEKELKNLIIKSNENNSLLITTEKDYFRIEETYKKNINYIKISIDLKNKEQFIDEINKII